MLRTFLSYLVLILVPAVSVGIAVVPYMWVKKKAKVSARCGSAFGGKSSRSVIHDSITPLAPLTLRGGRDREIASDERSGQRSSFAMTARDFKAVPLWWLWGAFLVGLVENVGWWSLILWITNDQISIYLGGTGGTGMILGIII